MVSMPLGWGWGRHKVTETVKSQKQVPTLLYGQLLIIKVFTFKHCLNNHSSRYIQCISNSSPSTMNKWKSVLQALLTRIRLANKCVICRLTPIVSV